MYTIKYYSIYISCVFILTFYFNDKLQDAKTLDEAPLILSTMGSFQSIMYYYIEIMVIWEQDLAMFYFLVVQCHIIVIPKSFHRQLRIEIIFCY